MTAQSPPPMVSLLPETAPFSTEQRLWLNGLFAGLMSLEAGGVTALSGDEAAALLPGLAGTAAEDEGDTPWHDQTIALAERMKMADGRSVRMKLMAAMAQQDCGQCGYDCKAYSGAIFERKEERLNLCVPGGKETARMVKALFEEIGKAGAPSPAAAAAIVAPAATPGGEAGRSREQPVTASFVRRIHLNEPGSEKETWHIDIDLEECGLDYVVGDAFGIYPHNPPELVEAVLKALDAPADFPVAGRTLREVLTDGVSLSPAPDMLFQLLSYISGGERRKKAKALAAGEDPDADAATLDVLAALEKFAGVRPDPEAFIEALDPMQPRLYSISSSPKSHVGRVSLTVDSVRYDIAGRKRLGVASTYFADRLAPGDLVRVYVQRAHAFGLPPDPKTPIIMVGPGTGIAPFRAFLQERMATKAPGENWLFFGHQRSSCDFFYKDELKAMQKQGVLSRLYLAWSRDTDEKFYVQDRMREVGRDLWSLIAEGAHIYICGDAKRMAKDVERALVDIVAQFGARTLNEATAFVAGLKKAGRFQQDVY